MRGMESPMGDTETKVIFLTTEADVQRSDSRIICVKRGMQWLNSSITGLLLLFESLTSKFNYLEGKSEETYRKLIKLFGYFFCH